MKKYLIGQTFPFFSDALCSDLEQYGQLRLASDRSVINLAGQRLSESIIILSGTARLSRETSGGAECMLCFLHAGSSFGTTLTADSVEEDHSSMLALTAVGDVRYLTLPFVDKDKLAHRHADWYAYILRASNYYHKLLLQTIDNVAFQSLDQRIDKLLTELSHVRDTDQIEISHQELATHLNSSREAVSRLLKKMEVSGKLNLHRNMIKLNKTMEV